MRVRIVVFPGSNCDRDMLHVVKDVYRQDAKLVWHQDGLPDDTEVIVLPGGFSYGDRLRAGIIAAHSPIIPQVRDAAKRGIPILGVCNGFQILTEAGLLPGALIRNSTHRYMCQWIEMVVENCNTPFTHKMSRSQRMPIPIANGEGRYYIDRQGLAKLKRSRQIVFRYAQNVNDSTDRIAAICNREGNVLGMMPHPERAAEAVINSAGDTSVSLIFESLFGGGS